jgi:hypothetical protein
VSRKRHSFLARPIAGAQIREEREARSHSLLFDMDAFRRAWAKPRKPWKDKRLGWMGEVK